ncbi:zinc-dependent metalloprotease [Iamia majanohamensis]|uniref:Zinc-dependent metalloprotease n=1 Tax=Iamia majanohamensis TaxID=467976 RepID=A0AAF0BWK0_9ACTN|nr:zinc-dependent metalloprotease [Iamia majanohamensis]WCO67539.1 zinc-dependent metalloprotease [Iamia majanohamensis]
MPFFGDLAKMIGRQGPISWDAARQIAHSIATEGAPEANVDPLARMQLEQLSRVAELQVANATGLEPSPSGAGITIVPVTRTQWVTRTLEDHRPRFEQLARSLGSEGTDPATGAPAAPPAVPDPDDPLGSEAGAWMQQLMGMLQPMTLGMAAGSMVGHLATRAFGQYDLPIPRPPGDEVMVQVPAIDAFAEEWSLGTDDVRLWVCLHEVAHHAVLNVPHVRAEMTRLVEAFVAGFRPDPMGFERALGEIDPADPAGLAAVQRVFSDPEVLLGAAPSPAQDEVRPRLDTLVAALVGWVDHVMDRVGGTLVGSYPQVTEAVRRRRVETSQADRFVERIFGLNLTQSRIDLGSAFVDGVVERAGEEGLGRLWSRPTDLPTPAELEAPGLWLARIDIDDDPTG